MANFNKKEVRVKSSVRKGKVVKGYNRFLNVFVKHDDKGKRKLTNTSKALIGLGTVGLIGAGAGLGYIARLQKLANAGAKTGADGKTIVNMDNPLLEAATRKVSSGYHPQNAPNLSADELKKLNSKIEATTKKTYGLTTAATGDDFTDLLDRRDYKNRYALDKRRENARGLTGGSRNYDEGNDLFMQINKNRRSMQGVTDPAKLKQSRKYRKEVAKLLRQQLGGRYKENGFSRNLVLAKFSRYF